MEGLFLARFPGLRETASDPANTALERGLSFYGDNRFIVKITLH
jgi:hypothetical protein